MRDNNPFAPWNDPMLRDDPFAPWNDPMKRSDPFACWNNPFGHGHYECEAQSYPKRPDPKCRDQ